jgi:glucose/arabinose dehydrogenase
MRTIILLTLAVALSALVACSLNENDNNHNPNQEVVEAITSQAEIVAKNLEIPWSIAKIGETLYVSQRNGAIIEISLETGDKQEQKLSLTKKVSPEGEGGSLGIVLKPDFEKSNQAYAYHTYQESDQILNRVIVIQKEGHTWVEKDVLLEGIPGGRIHNGGRMEIGPDDKLYITTGDAGTRENAQDLQSLAGKILRMNLDGTIPTDNPFPNSYVYSYGHRNPQGLAWDEQGNLYSTEHGQIAHDEINIIKPGKNYGWPIIEGEEAQEGMEKPIFQTGDSTWAPSGMAYYKGQLYIATLRDSRIRTYDINSGKDSVLYEQGGRMRDIYIEGNTLFASTSNLDGRGDPQEDDDKIIKIILE